MNHVEGQKVANPIDHRIGLGLIDLTGYLQTLADQEQQLKAQNVQQRMGVLGMVNPGILGPSIAQAANAENIARQNYNAINPFAGVLNLVPYFPGMGDDAGATGGTAGGGGGTGGQSSGKGSRVMGPF